MGLPKIKFTADAIWAFVANHGEKILVAIVVLVQFAACMGRPQRLEAERPDLRQRNLLRL